MLRTFLAATALLSAYSIAGAQSVLQSCEQDIAAYCAEVEPGHGRIAACLYAHEMKISDGCDAATGEIGDVIDLFFSRIQDVHAACSEDAVKFCSDVDVGGGRLLSCLRENKSGLSQSCTGLVDTIPVPEG
ncbi:MAG: cysteine rich repeat-containing protein [Pseudomonadota bacterium]